MAKAQQVILLSPNQYLEHLLWTIGVPYEICQPNDLKTSVPLWICQTEQELELAQQCFPHQHLFYLPALRDQDTSLHLAQLTVDTTMQSWSTSSLPFLSGVDGVDWIGPRIQFDIHPIWSHFNESLCFKDRTLYWGFVLAEIFHNQKVTSKAFFFSTQGNRLPHEEVSSLSKGEIIILFRESLRYLLSQSNQNLYTYPTQPQGYGGVFLWKVDTDGADLETLTQYVKLLNQHQIRGSFFLDLEPLKGQQISEMAAPLFQGHEWNLHCLEHRAYELEKNSLNDLKDGHKSALYFLKNIDGLHLQASSAPYGVHAPFLSQIQEDLGFCYASEFGWAYHSWPMQVQANQASLHQWQVPFHPICPQSLDAAHYNTQSKISYFNKLAQVQISLGLPVAWYDHPSHKDPHFLPHLLELAQAFIHGQDNGRLPLKVMTSGEYLKWWIHDRPQLEMLVNPAPCHKTQDSTFHSARQFNFRRWKQDKLRKHIYRRKQ